MLVGLGLFIPVRDRQMFRVRVPPYYFDGLGKGVGVYITLGVVMAERSKPPDWEL